MPMNSTKSFPYKLGHTEYFLAIFVSGVLAFITASMAKGNTKSLSIFNVFLLSPPNASLFFWTLSAVCLLGIAYGLFGLFFQAKYPQHLKLTPVSITVPAGEFSKKEITVPIGSINFVQMREVKGYKVLVIVHETGALTIPQVKLPDEKSIHEIYDFLKNSIPNG